MSAMTRMLLVLACMGALGAAPAWTQDGPAPAKGKPGQVPRAEAFKTPEDGFAALADAIRAGDEPRLVRMLGDDARSLVRSGDPVADQAARGRFTAEYAAKHDILRPAPDRAELQIGNDNWPLPIPLVMEAGEWRFDVKAGARELVDRRIGRNELDTIETLRAIADAQYEYSRTAGRQGALRSYARRFFSNPGQKDGLYWPDAPGQPQSPLGPMAAAASAGGYSTAKFRDQPQPFHGYFFRMLDSQGPAAEGGAMDYLVNGKMIGGFAVLAYPAQYGVSGIKSFLVNHSGMVWEQDLGPATARQAGATTSFNPGPGWDRVP